MSKQKEITPEANDDSFARLKKFRWLNNMKQWLALRAALPIDRIRGQRNENTCGILMYHRVADRIPGHPTPTWNVTPQRFYQQISGLQSAGFQAISLKKLLELSESGMPIPPRSFVITFDDGYANNYVEAWPILKRLNAPATIFLATDYLDSAGPFPFDDWSMAGSRKVPTATWKPMTTDQCYELLEDDLIELAAHTHTHADFRGKPDELCVDLEKCLEVLHNKFGLEHPTFAFPYGTRHLGFSGPVLEEAAKRAGVCCSLTTESEVVVTGSDPYTWGRFTAEQSDSAATLAVKIDGWFSCIRDMWRFASNHPAAVLPTLDSQQRETTSSH